MLTTNVKYHWSAVLVAALLFGCDGEQSPADREQGSIVKTESAPGESESPEQKAAPATVTIAGTGLTLDLPAGYGKAENSERLYPIVIDGRWGARWAFTDEVRARYPAFFLSYQKSSEADGEALSDVLDAAIAQGHRIDLNRVYLIGFSAGGSGSYKLARGLAKKGKLFAAINRVAGQSETLLPDGAVAATSIWLHIGTADEPVRIEVTRDAYNNLKNHPLNKSATETAATDEDVIGFKRVTRTLTKDGVEIVKYSVCEGMGHDPKPVYKDPEVLKWMFAQSLERRKARPDNADRQP
jgi:dienelactone hydrolase